MNLERVNFQSSPEERARLVHDFLNAQRAELLPDDPAIPFEEQLGRWRHPPTHKVSLNFALLEGERVLGLLEAAWHDDEPENGDVAWAYLSVDPEVRGRGLGLQLVHALLEELPPERTKLFFSTYAHLADGELFAESLGARRGLEEHTNQLLLAERNREYLRRALEQPLLERFEAVWFDDDYPESELEALCEMFAVLNTAPRGELEYNDSQFTPEQLRQEAEDNRRHGRKFWLLLARDRHTGRYAGFTETTWHPNRPQTVQQHGTGVHLEFQGRGLGAWLKATMLERIIRDQPVVDRIRTGNADSNVPMLRINHGLGFKPFLARTEWQLEVRTALERLEVRATVRM